MKKLVIISFVIISILGTLSHFVYEWSSCNKFLGYFFAVNESTWEHLKLLFFPSIFYYIFEYFLLKTKPQNYISATALGILCGMIFIVISYYSYTGVLGYNLDFLNITIYYLGVVVMLTIRSIIISKKLLCSNASNIVFSTIILGFAWLFFIYTYSPPAIGIFTPPTNV